MPAPRIPARAPGRRAMLQAGLAGAAAAVVLGTSGCRLRVGSPDSGRPPAGREPTPTADQLALSRVSDRAAGLTASYAQAIRVRPDLDPGLRQLAADHTAHVQAIQALQPTSAASVSSSTSTSTSSGTSATPTGPVLTATTALSVLGQAERVAISATLADLASVGPQAARLLASIAACGSAHVAVLTGLPSQASAKTVGTPSKQAP